MAEAITSDAIYTNQACASQSLKVGEEFCSLIDLEKAIRQYELNEYCNLSKFNIRTIEGARKKGLKRYVNPALEYVCLNYMCVQYQSRSKGLRINQNSYRSNCPVMISVRPNDSGDKLIIKSFVTEHNHIRSEAMFNHYPRQRRLDSDAKVIASKLVSMKVNKKILQNDLMKIHNKIVTLKDIHNLTLSNSSNANALRTLVENYQNKQGVTLEILKNDKNELKALFYQDEEMKRIFSLCSEVLFVDAIYKVNDLRLPLYVFLVVDSNGQNEVVGYCLLTSEDLDNVTQMASVFKSHNPSWKNIKCIMADKDFTERNVFRDQFPQAQILICIFHCMRSFSREITTEKMNITIGQRMLCLKLAQEMVYAKNEKDYDRIYKELKGTEITSVLKYFEKNWHQIKNEWVVYLQSKYMTLGNRTNNRLESINQKITQVVTKFSRVDQLFEGLEMLMITLRTERDHAATVCFCKTPSFVSRLNSEQKEMFWYLTPYAFDLIFPKYESMNSVKIISIDETTKTAIIQSREGNIEVSPNKCACSFVSSLCLPCHHIFKLRKINNITLYCPDLCAERWTRKYYSEVCRIIPSESSENPSSEHVEYVPVNIRTVEPIRKKRILNQHEKYQRAHVEAKRLASLASEASNQEFERRLNILRYIAEAWEKEERIDIEDLEMCMNQPTNVQSDFEVIEVTEFESTETIEVTGMIEPVEAIESVEKIQPIEIPLLPPRVPKRGRPKGKDMTAIGISKKRKVTGLVAIDKLEPNVRNLEMLNWFVDNNIATITVSGNGIISETAVENDPDKIPCAVLDNTVSIDHIRQYFDNDGWTAIKQVFSIKKLYPKWICPVCSKDSATDSVCCNRCLKWLHLKCVKVNPKLKKKCGFVTVAK